ncbi:unnamed protein product [Cochlearia groenlandica]
MSSSEASYFKSWKEYVPSPSVKINKDPLVASPDFDKNLPYHKFLWSFRDFSLLKQKDYVSISFSMKERKWNLKLYPKGDSRSCGGLSFYLHLDDLEVLSTGQMMFVRQDVRALDPRRRGWVMPSTRANAFPLSIT